MNAYEIKTNLLIPQLYIPPIQRLVYNVGGSLMR